VSTQKNVKYKCGHAPTAHEIGEDCSAVGTHYHVKNQTTEGYQVSQQYPAVGYDDQSHTSSSQHCITSHHSCSPGHSDYDLLPKYNNKSSK